MNIEDTTTEKSIMEDVEYVERVNNSIVELNNKYQAIRKELEEARDLREHLQDSLSEHIGENEIDISQFESMNRSRIERWLVAW